MYSNSKFNRPQTNDDFDIPTRDDGTPFIHNPVKGNFEQFSSAAKHILMEHSLNWEQQDKYLNRYMGRFKSKIELRTIPECFKTCVTSVDDTFLNPREKNCMRECFFKKVNAKDDMSYLMLQLAATSKVDNLKEGTD